MRDSDSTPPAAPTGDRTFYVINLCASPVPLPLEMPPGPGLEGLVVFRSHELQDGRHRYRLHLGYFDSRDSAERALPQVQARYPTAWIAAAPRTQLGSLDDTGATDFRLIQAPATKLAAFSVAEPPPPAPAVAAPTPAPEEGDEPQRYAVQLIWSSDRTEPASLPPIALFDAYTLYTVTCQRGGVRLYGVRLGFFRSAISASQVAVYVRPDFPSVAVVPVSDREFAYASWLARHRGGSRPVAKAAEAPLPAAAAEPTSFAEPAVPEDAATSPVDVPRSLKQPTQVEIAQIRSPEEVPLVLREPVAPAAAAAPVTANPATPPASARPRHWGQAHRPPDLDKEARLAALGAHEIKLRAAKFDPQDERGAAIPEARPYRSQPFAERRSVLARLIERFTDRRN